MYTPKNCNYTEYIYLSMFPEFSQISMLVTNKMNQAVKVVFNQCLVQTLAGTLAILTEVFPGVTQQFQLNSWVVPQIWPSLFNLKSFLVNYQLMILVSDTVQPKPLSETLKTP